MKIRFPVILLLFLGISCEPENLAPEALFTCSPPEGNIKTLFDLDATASIDPDGLKTLLTYRWDIYNDGQWENDFGPWKLFSCRFPVTGTYSIRLEVKDSFGAVSSSVFEVKVNSLQSITDPRDGQVYPVVKLGSYWWFARNLNVGKQVDPDNLNGGFYSWSEAMAGEKVEGAQGICPPGWHIPSNSEWKNMLSVFRSESPVPAFTYKISNVKFVPDQVVTHDNYQQSGAVWRLLRETGSTGFDVVMAGYIDPDGKYGDSDYHFPGKTASFWTSSTYGDYRIRVRMYSADTGHVDVFKFADNPLFSFSIRCVKESL